jgi:hypothetical protein
MAINFDIKTGQVFVRNFDQGVVETMGGYLDYAQGGSKQNYFINIPNADPMKVPVIFSNPFQPMEKKILPSFMIRRESITPALARWHSVGNIQYNINSGEVISVDGVSGFSDSETLVQAFPYDIEYSINIMAFYEHEAIPMLKKVLSVYKPFSRIIIKDSLSETRTYTVFNESAVQDISEIVDINDRMKAYMVTIRVEGELDLSDPEINKKALLIKNNIYNN